MIGNVRTWVSASLACLALFVWLGCAGHGTGTHHRHGQHGGSEKEQPHHRRPTDINEYLERLDRPERDQYQKPAQVIEALALKPGTAVADLGAGSGYFTRRFVRAVGETGTVYAIDVEQEMLDYVKAGLDRMEGNFTATFILARPDSPGLPPNSVDLIFVCNVYHHLEDRTTYFRKATPTLRAGGRVAIIDFYHDHRSGDIGFPRRHLVSRETVVQEMTRAGYSLIADHTFLERQYFLEFAPAD